MLFPLLLVLFRYHRLQSDLIQFRMIWVSPEQEIPTAVIRPNPMDLRPVVADQLAILQDFTPSPPLHQGSIPVYDRHVHPRQLCREFPQLYTCPLGALHQHPQGNIGKVSIRLTRPRRRIASPNV